MGLLRAHHGLWDSYANRYLTYQMGRVLTGEITPRWLEDCLRTAEHFVKLIGANRPVSDLLPDDFCRYRQALLRRGLSGRKGLGVHALDRSVVVVRAMFLPCPHALDSFQPGIRWNRRHG